MDAQRSGQPRPRITVLRQTPASVLLDGDRVAGVGATEAMRRAIDLARQSGLACAGCATPATSSRRALRGDGGAGRPGGLRLRQRDPLDGPHRGPARTFGTNPLAFAFPAGTTTPSSSTWPPAPPPGLRSAWPPWRGRPCPRPDPDRAGARPQTPAPTWTGPDPAHGGEHAAHRATAWRWWWTPSPASSPGPASPSGPASRTAKRGSSSGPRPGPVPPPGRVPAADGPADRADQGRGATPGVEEVLVPGSGGSAGAGPSWRRRPSPWGTSPGGPSSRPAPPWPSPCPPCAKHLGERLPHCREWETCLIHSRLLSCLVRQSSSARTSGASTRCSAMNQTCARWSGSRRSPGCRSSRRPPARPPPWRSAGPPAARARAPPGAASCCRHLLPPPGRALDSGRLRDVVGHRERDAPRT